MTLMCSFLRRLLVVLSLLCVELAVAQSSHDLRSPDNRIEIRVRTADRIRYDVLLNGRSLLENCTLTLDVNHQKLGLQPKVTDAKQRSNNQLVKPAVRQKFAEIRDNYNEL